MPLVNRLPLQKLYHFALSLILENEGTLKGIYSVLRNIFSSDDSKYDFQEGQLGYKENSFNNKELVLINKD